MKKQSKSKTKEIPKQKNAKKKSKSKKKQPEEKTTETEEEQANREVTENKKTDNETSENTEAPKTDETPEPHIEPQSRPAYNPETDLNQSQVQALRSRFSHLTAEHFEGGTAEEVLQRLAETTGTDINELRTIIKAWEG